WISHGFGRISEENLAVLAATLIIIGIQIFFSSFLLSILGLRRPDYDPRAEHREAAPDRAASAGKERPGPGARSMRLCLVYDCLFPHTVGGAERWYRNLAERLAADGHEVTYLTLRQWDRGADPGVGGVDVHAVGPRLRLYSWPGRRRIWPPLVFGA